MKKRSTYQLREKILFLLKESESLTLTQIQTKLSTNYESVKNNCQDLETYGLIEIKKEKKHSKNGKPYYSVKLTKEGYSTLNRIANKN